MYDSNHYSEAEQLTTLLNAFARLMERDVENDTISVIRIYVGNKRVKLLAGAPQFEGICKMVESIASENLYDVDFKNLLVTDSRPTTDKVCIKALKYCLEQVKTSKIDILGMPDDCNEYFIKRAIKTLQQEETER